MDKKLDHLIEVLYESALDASRWLEVLGLCGQYAGGVDALFMTVEKTNNTPTAAILAGTRFSIESRNDYISHYMYLDPRQKSMLNVAVDEWLPCHHSYDQKFFDNSEYGQDFMTKIGCRFSMGGLA